MGRGTFVALVAFLLLALPALAGAQAAQADLVPTVENLGDTSSWEFWVGVLVPWLVTLASAMSSGVSSSGRFAKVMKVVDVVALNIVKARNDPAAQAKQAPAKRKR